MKIINWYNHKINNVKNILFIILMFGFGISYSQQDPMFTKYMFNALWYNPAYAGSNEHMTLNLIHRSQWIGIDGAPQTQSFTIHTPLENNKVGVGFSLVNDKIGPTNTLMANFSYAYRIPVGFGKLSFGLEAGITNFRADWSKLIVDPDPNFQYNVNKWYPNFGAGIYYYTNRFYVGVGVPHLLEYDISPQSVTNDLYAKQYRHYYFSMGGAINLKGPDLIFKPSILIKNVGLLSKFSKDSAFMNVIAPTEFDLDLSLFFYQTLWVGTAFRSSFEAFNGTSTYDSFDVWMAYFLGSGLRLGLAYDYSLPRELRSINDGSIELMLGYEFDYKTKRVVTPRYF